MPHGVWSRHGTVVERRREADPGRPGRAGCVMRDLESGPEPPIVDKSQISGRY